MVIGLVFLCPEELHNHPDVFWHCEQCVVVCGCVCYGALQVKVRFAVLARQTVTVVMFGYIGQKIRSLISTWSFAIYLQRCS